MKKKYNAFIILISIFAMPLFSQPDWNKANDTLLHSIKNNKNNDTSKVMQLINYCKEHRFCQPLENMKLADEAQSLAKKLNFEKGIALAYISKGYFYHTLAKYDTAGDNFEMALKIAVKINDKILQVDALNGLCWTMKYNNNKRMEIALKSIELAKRNGYERGIIQPDITLSFIYLTNDLTKAADLALDIIKLSEKFNDVFGTFNYNDLMCRIFFRQKSYKKAEDFALEGLKIAENVMDCECLYSCNNNLGEIYNNWGKYDKALYYYKKALNISEFNGDMPKLCIDYGNIAEIYMKTNKLDEALDALKKSNLYGELFSANYKLGYIYYMKKQYGIARKYLEISKDECLLGITKLIDNLNATTYLIPTLELLAKCYDKLGLQKQSKEILWLMLSEKDSLYNKDKANYTLELTEKYQADKKDLANKNLRQKSTIQELEIKNQRNSEYALFLGIIILISIVAFIFKERKKSEKLLLNILPQKIAKRLKKGENKIADQFEEASVVFIDIVDFTKTSAGTEPKRVTEVLNILYSKLDLLARKHGLEKIKTIGDCYMAAAGIPIIDPDNAVKAANFVIEVKELLKDYDTGDGTILQFRYGVDCGPVVAGVIGDHKFIYDVWGDTVNTASRMEQYGVVGKIQVTERFKEAITNYERRPFDFAKGDMIKNEKKFKFEERGEIDIKGKGRMRTWFLSDNYN
jgi:adenylate cyclase